MPNRASSPPGERISRLEAKFDAYEQYSHERWHQLANDITPLLALPERMTREIGKLQGTVDGRINSVEKALERSLTAAIEKALTPVKEDVAELRNDVEGLKKQSNILTGAKLLLIFVVQTLLACAAAFAGQGWFSRGGHP